MKYLLAAFSTLLSSHHLLKGLSGHSVSQARSLCGGWGRSWPPGACSLGPEARHAMLQRAVLGRDLGQGRLCPAPSPGEAGGGWGGSQVPGSGSSLCAHGSAKGDLCCSFPPGPQPPTCCLHCDGKEAWPVERNTSALHLGSEGASSS